MMSNLEVLRELPSSRKDGKYIPGKYEVRCHCGNIFFANKFSISGNKTKSCGCLWKAMRKKQTPNMKHGAKAKNKRLYGIWAGMVARCNNEDNRAFRYYGGRGIKVCDEWRDSYNFYKWAIENGYEETLTLDRYPNCNGDYEPSNCRWATTKEQGNNKSNTVHIEYNGKSQNLSDWAKELGISLSVLHRRIKIWKLPIEEAFLAEAEKPYVNKKDYILNPDIAVCIRSKLKLEGRKQTWVVKKMVDKGIATSDYLLSLKLNGKDFFTKKELEVVNELLGTNFR